MKSQTKSFIYSPEIYNTQSAEQVVPFLIELCEPQSVVDVGCGLGTWLYIFEKQGVENILGLDNGKINLNDLLIKKEQFIPHNLSEEITLNQKYDLALCLEVAEHLPENKADILINSLVNLSDIIVFSAAIPKQGGQGHLNEQWHTYWQEKFEKYNFYFYDVLRPVFWQNEKVDWWYKQNMFLVIKENIADENLKAKIKHLPTFNNQQLVHYQLFTKVSTYLETIKSGKLGIRKTANIFWKALIRFR